MRIGFPLSISGGGPSLFMKRLRRSISHQKLAVSSFFFDPFTSINVYANHVRNPWNKPYIFRVDGITFDSMLTPQEIERRNRPIFEGMDEAIGIVFQSKFDLEFISRVYNVSCLKQIIINNGVNLNEFFREGANKRANIGIREDEVVFITSAKWRAHKRLDSVIEVFRLFRDKFNKYSHLIVLGSLENNVVGSDPGIHIIGHVEPQELPAWYRTGDIFLFFSWLDHCPNSVVEALACGLPVVCTNQGGTRELVEMTNGGIVVEADEPFHFEQVDLYNPPLPDQNTLLEAVIKMAEHRDEYASIIDHTAINIDVVAQRYVNFAEKVYRKQF